MQEGCFKAGIMSSAAFTQGCMSNSVWKLGSTAPCRPDEQLLGASLGVNMVVEYWPTKLDLLDCIGLEMD
jgi:hypothetical protein